MAHTFSHIQMTLEVEALTVTAQPQQRVFPRLAQPPPSQTGHELRSWRCRGAEGICPGLLKRKTRMSLDPNRTVSITPG